MCRGEATRDGHSYRKPPAGWDRLRRDGVQSTPSPGGLYLSAFPLEPACLRAEKSFRLMLSIELLHWAWCHLPDFGCVKNVPETRNNSPRSRICVQRAQLLARVTTGCAIRQVNDVIALRQKCIAQWG